MSDEHVLRHRSICRNRAALEPLCYTLGEKIAVPTAFARFPKDIVPPPREWVERGYNLTRWTEMPRGGLFAAMEEPMQLAQDIRTAFRQG